MSLARRGIVVTRPRELAEPLADALSRRGARPIVFPAIEIEPLPPPPALQRIAEYDILVFVSPSAVHVGLRAVPQWPRGVTAAAIGSGTRRELQSAGVSPVIAPAAGADSESLLAAPQMHDVAGKRVLIVRGENGRPTLGDALRARGAHVEYADCYRRRRPIADEQPLLEAWRRGDVDALTVSSSEGLDNFLVMTGAEGRALLAKTPLFVPHPRVASHATFRLKSQIVVAGPGDDELIERLVAYFDERR
ncbi:MAG TPA: uroporphyrinogen-III synthase [Burkholderiales bacterium]|nr:uroporphyrinogen-III synthase [Burkholderiales bacterium]